MKVNFYLDTILDTLGESKILVSICCRGARYQTSVGYKTPPGFWNKSSQRMLDGAITLRGYESAEINSDLAAIKSHFEHLDCSNMTTEFLRDAFHEFVGRPVAETSLDLVEFRRSLGTRIASFRMEEGLSQEDMAVRSGLSRRLIVNIENGTTAASIDSYLKVLKVLGQTLVVTSCDE